MKNNSDRINMGIIMFDVGSALEVFYLRFDIHNSLEGTGVLFLFASTSRKQTNWEESKLADVKQLKPITQS